MKIYKGSRVGQNCLVMVDDRPLDPRYDLKALSSSGFEWGYEGGGPSQLALAILADLLEDDAKALAEYRNFLKSTIVNLADDKWELEGADIKRSLEEVVHVGMTLEQLLNKVRGLD